MKLPYITLLWLGLIHCQLCESAASLPAPPQFFNQVVNHLDDNDKRTYPQRYYTHNAYFQGPGSPIFLILGGEGAIEPGRGIMYSVVAERFAKTLGAAVISPEHRFYGDSQPISREEIQHARDKGLTDPRVELLTTEQALYDAVRLTRFLQTSVLGCSTDKASDDYCPVVAVGGSYPGFLAATIRLQHANVVDAAYAASAPMKFYAQLVPQKAYFAHITRVAEEAYPTCAAAVQTVLTHAVQALPTDPFDWGLCPATVPPYAANDPVTLAQEVMMIVAVLFANSNMGYYSHTPTWENTRLWQLCDLFVQHTATEVAGTTYTRRTRLDAVSVVHDVLIKFLAPTVDAPCLDLRSQLPTGPHATVSAGDWSGVGTGPGGESWDFQTCKLDGCLSVEFFFLLNLCNILAFFYITGTLLVEAIGFDAQASMFPSRPWSLAWLRQHCQKRFGVTPQPHKLVQNWRFDAAGLVAQNASYILFTNGLHDGWSVSGFQQNLTDTLVAVNFPTGAHHSDLSGPTDPALNTDDINKGRDAIEALLEQWLHDIRETHRQSSRSAHNNLSASQIKFEQ